MRHDLRFAIRMIRTHAWFSAAIVATLALGIGINTTVFILVNAVLFKPVPIPGGDRLVTVMGQSWTNPGNQFPVSFPDFVELKNGNSAFETLEAAEGAAAILSENGNPPARYRMSFISAGLFPMVKTAPILGRAFSESDAKAGAERVALIAHRVWQSRYSGATDLPGRTVRINGIPATIIGVMPEGFLFPNGHEVWMPLIPDAAREKRSNRSLRLFGMLKSSGPGASVSGASADLAVIARRLSTAYPDTNKDAGIAVQTFHQAFNGGNIRTVFLLMLGAVGFVLLIACANVANMMLSRALARRRENSVRSALGASRWQLVRQLLVESVLLSLTGGILGLGLSSFAVHYFDLATLSERPYWIAFDMDYVAYLYFAAISVLSGVFFGVLPALRASRVDLASELKEGTRNMIAAAGGGRGGGRVTGTLVVLQFALTVVLLCAAGLMIRSFFKAQTINPFVPESEISIARVTLPDSQDTPYAGKPERIRFFEDLERRLAAIPGVSQAAIAESLPGGGSGHDPVEIEGQPSTASANGSAANSTIRASTLVISPNYLSLIGASMQEGRGFTAQDGDPGRESAIATRQFVNRFFPNQQAIGKRFRMVVNGKPGPWNEIVGITSDIMQNPQRTEGEDHPLVYFPYRQFGWRGMALLVRASNATSPAAAASVAANLATPVKAVVQQMDQDLPVFDSSLLKTALERQRWHLGVFGSLFLSFAIIGLLIASVGIYAVGAQAAASRTREIGIRMALGAGTRDILATMLSRGLTYLGVGLTLGLGGALGVTGLMKGLLMQVSPHDPLVIGTVVAVLAGLGFFACWLPAHRAASLHPVEALRDE